MSIYKLEKGSLFPFFHTWELSLQASHMSDFRALNVLGGVKKISMANGFQVAFVFAESSNIYRRTLLRTQALLCVIVCLCVIKIPCNSYGVSL